MAYIRDAKKEDATVIYECIYGLAEHVKQTEMVKLTVADIEDRFFTTEHIKVFVAENGEGAICGYTLIFKSFSTFEARTNFHIEDLFVFPEYQSLGIGKLFMEHIKDYAKSQGANTVDWYVNNANLTAMAFYEKIGAKKLGYKSIYYIEF